MFGKSPYLFCDKLAGFYEKIPLRKVSDKVPVSNTTAINEVTTERIITPIEKPIPNLMPAMIVRSNLSELNRVTDWFSELILSSAVSDPFFKSFSIKSSAGFIEVVPDTWFFVLRVNFFPSSL